MLLFYEATEGGAGVLRQLIDMPSAVAEVAREALQLCHFDPDTGTDLLRAERSLEDCEAACYHCLMTYANQREHRQLDRQSIQGYLQALMLTHTIFQVPDAIHSEIFYEQLLQQADSEIEQLWLQELRIREGCFYPRRCIKLLDSVRLDPISSIRMGVLLSILMALRKRVKSAMPH